MNEQAEREYFEKQLIDEGRRSRLHMHPLHDGIYQNNETTRRFNSFKRGIEYARSTQPVPNGELVENIARKMYYSWWDNEAEESFENSGEKSLFTKIAKVALSALPSQPTPMEDEAVLRAKINELQSALTAAHKAIEFALLGGVFKHPQIKQQLQDAGARTCYCGSKSGHLCTFDRKPGHCVYLGDAGVEEKARDYLEDVSAIHALIGYVESLDASTGIRQQYLDRLKSHYIPNALAVLERRKP